VVMSSVSVGGIAAAPAIRAGMSEIDPALRRSSLDNMGILNETLTESEANIPVVENLIETTKRDMRILEEELERRNSPTSQSSASTTTISGSGNVVNISEAPPERPPSFGGNMVATPGI